MPDPIPQSRARKLAIAVAALIEPIVSTRAQVMTLWHPAFADKGKLKDPIVNVRPASRGRTDDGKATGPNDVVLEFAIVQSLPKPEAGEDAWNCNDTIDGLDSLAEELFDLFVRVDPDELPEGSTRGSLSRTNVFRFVPSGAPEQPATIENALLDSDRIFLTVFTVPYRRWE
jgi:hypothetical protein